MKKIFMFSAIALTVLSSCSKNDSPGSPQFLETSITLYADQSQRLFDGEIVDVETSTNFIATVSSNGMVYAHHVGEATISSGSQSCRVTVRPRYNLYADPYLEWGASRSQVQSRLGTADSDNGEMLMYRLERDMAAAYAFENNRLAGVMVVVPIIYSSTLVDHLLERYNAAAIGDVVGGSTDDFIFANGTDEHRPDTAVVASLEGLDYWAVMYVPYPTETRSESTATDTIEKLKQEILSQLGLGDSGE